MRKINLTAKRVARLLKRPGRYRDDHVRGLLLVVVSKRNASWQLRFERNGRERWLGLGPVHTVGLKQARERAKAARLQLLDGIDPIDTKKANKATVVLEAARSLTFEKAARQYFDQVAGGWKNAKHRAQFLSTMQRYAFPVIGKLSVADIETRDVLRILENKAHEDYPGQRLWDAIPETMSRLRGRIEGSSRTAAKNFRNGSSKPRWTAISMAPDEGLNS